MIATITEPQWFIVRGWLDNQEWGDEPPDPDDLWAVGDRVRLRNSTVEGTVLLNENQPFLGSYLPYVLVQWDNKSFSVPIEPELLVRLTRLIPPGLTWKASQSFNDVGDEPEPHLDDIFTFSSDIPPSVKVEDKTLDLTEPETVLMVEDLTVSTRVEQPKLETVLMVEDLTVSTRVEQPKLETVLMVEDLTVSTRVEQPKLETVLMVEDLTVSTRVEQPKLETVLMVEDLTVSTRVEQPKLETVLMVEDLTVSTRVEQPKLETVLMVEDLTVSTRVEQPKLEPVLMVEDLTVSTARRSRGSGTGRIQWRTITKKNGKQYQQPWYDWQMHLGEKTVSKSTYIPKRFFTNVLELEVRKAPVKEILKLLGIDFFTSS